MRNGAAGFQRVKRGWVWNQFFVLEEYMGSDPQYVGKVWCGKNHKSLINSICVKWREQKNMRKIK